MKTEINPETGDDSSRIADFMRIADALEKLENAARNESDPVRQEHLYNVLAEAICT